MNILRQRSLLELTLPTLLAVLLLVLAAVQFRLVDRLARSEAVSREALTQVALLGVRNEIETQLEAVLLAMRSVAAAGTEIDLGATQRWPAHSLAPRLYFVGHQPVRSVAPLWRLQGPGPQRFEQGNWSELLQAAGAWTTALATRGHGATLDAEASAALLVVAARARLPGEMLATSGYLLAPIDTAALTKLVQQSSRQAVDASPVAGLRIEPALADQRDGMALPSLQRFPDQPLAGHWQLRANTLRSPAAAVADSLRWRNLGVAFGILMLLAASSALLWVSARRVRSLGTQRLQMVAAVSHEMRTPLAVIQSAGANLADGVVTQGERVREYGNLIRSEAQRLHRLVENALHLGGLSQQTPRRGGEQANLHQVLGRVLERVEQTSGAREIIVSGNEPTIANVAMSSADLELVLTNLIDNAIRYGDPATPLSIALTSRNSTLQLSVSNSCVNLGNDEVDRLFEPFFRGHQARSLNPQGSGLGLSLVQGIVSRSGGEVSADCVRGQLRIRVMLPLKTPATS